MALDDAERVPSAEKLRQQNELMKSQFSRTRLCKFYAMNQCRYGDRCNFAHGPTNLAAIPDLKKTSICKEYKHGKCPLQSAECPFAHGRGELRQTEAYMQKDIKALMKTPLPERLSPVHVEVHTMDTHGAKKAGARERFGTGLSSVSTRSSSKMTDPEPAWVEAEELQSCLPSVMLCNLPRKYTKKMLTTEIKEMGFEIPRDVVSVHVPVAADTQLNRGHCLVTFSKENPLKAFVEVFHGRMLRHFQGEGKRLMVLCRMAPSSGGSPSPSVDDEPPEGVPRDQADGLGWPDHTLQRQSPSRACPRCSCADVFLGPRFCQYCGFNLIYERHPADLAGGIVIPGEKQGPADGIWQ